MEKSVQLIVISLPLPETRFHIVLTFCTVIIVEHENSTTRQKKINVEGGTERPEEEDNGQSDTSQ